MDQNTFNLAPYVQENTLKLKRQKFMELFNKKTRFILLDISGFTISRLSHKTLLYNMICKYF